MIGYETRKVLVMDTQQERLDEVTGILLEMGFQAKNIVRATNTEQAVYALEHEGVGVVLAELPKDALNALGDTEEGYSVCTIIKERGNVPVIITSYISEGLGPFRAVAIRAQGYISRPLSKVSLQKNIDRFLRIYDLEQRLDQLSTKKLKDINDAVK